MAPVSPVSKLAGESGQSIDLTIAATTSRSPAYPRHKYSGHSINHKCSAQSTDVSEVP